MAFTIKVNGNTHSVDVDDDTPLLWVLRDVLGMTGTKFGCGMALCGACTVHLDGNADPLLHHPDRQHRHAADHHDRGHRRDAGRRQDPEGLARPRGRRNAAIASRARSCPLRRCWRPTRIRRDADIDAAMSGNICRCGTYVRIREAIKHAAQSTEDREADNDPRSYRFPHRSTSDAIRISERSLPAQAS